MNRQSNENGYEVKIIVNATLDMKNSLQKLADKVDLELSSYIRTQWKALIEAGNKPKKKVPSNV